MVKQKTMRTIGIIFAVIALFVSISALFNKSWAIGVGGLIASLLILYFSINLKIEPQKIPFTEVLKNYKFMMETEYEISFPKNVKIVHLNEDVENYIAVISYEDKDEAKDLFFPFEANKFSGEFGRGAGQMLDDIREVEFWINKNDKSINAGNLMAQKMGSQIARSIQMELDRQKSSGGEEPNDNKQVETSGGY